MTISTATPFNALLFVYASALCGALGCVSNEGNAAAGGAGGSSTGGSTSATGGTTGTTGGAPSGGAAGAGTATACALPTGTLISDFSTPDALDSAKVTFVGPPSGGTYHYPKPTDVPAPMFPIASDASLGNWRISGTIGSYSGFGLYFDSCSKVDASQYKGIRFKIQGSVAMGETVQLNVGTAADEIAASWFNSHKAAPSDADRPPNFGRCMPATGQYDGTCGSPSKAIPVTATATTITVLWADLLGGKPEASVNPSELIFISWSFPPPAGAGTTAPTTYMADVTIDDLEFVP